MLFPSVNVSPFFQGLILYPSTSLAQKPFCTHGVLTLRALLNGQVLQIAILYYKAKSLCIYLIVCTFALSSVILTNRLIQALKICIDYNVNLLWSSKHIFNFLHFVIQKLRVFLKNELNELVYASRNQNIYGHSSRYVTEGGAKMLQIRRFRNNDTRAFRKYWRGTEFRVINSKAI